MALKALQTVPFRHHLQDDWWGGDKDIEPDMMPPGTCWATWHLFDGGGTAKLAQITSGAGNLVTYTFALNELLHAAEFVVKCLSSIRNKNHYYMAVADSGTCIDGLVLQDLLQM